MLRATPDITWTKRRVTDIVQSVEWWITTNAYFPAFDLSLARSVQQQESWRTK